MNEASERTVTFRVTYIEGAGGIAPKNSITCLIEMRQTQNLDDLANAIIEGWFEWLIPPHLYEFSFDNELYSGDPEKKYIPDFARVDDSEEGYKLKKSTRTTLAELNLHLRQRFTFLFDFGDDHVFSVKVVKFGVGQKERTYPCIFETQGKIPAQY